MSFSMDALGDLRGALTGYVDDMQAARREREDGFRTYASEDTWGAVRSAILRVTQDQGVPGLGGHGVIVQAEEVVDIDRIASCPYRVRTWKPRGDAVRRRADSITKNPFGQVDPIIVTPIVRDDPLFADTPRADLMVIDGEGTLQGLLLHRKSQARVKVVMSPLHHGPLKPYEVLFFWLTRTTSAQRATKRELVSAVLRMRSFWEQMTQAAGQRAPFISDREIAEVTGASKAMITYARQVNEQPPEVIALLTAGLLHDSHVMTLHRLLPDPSQRLVVAERIAEENRLRLAARRALLPASAITGVIHETYPQLALPAGRSDVTGGAEVTEAQQEAASRLLDALEQFRSLSGADQLPPTNPVMAALRAFSGAGAQHELERLATGAQPMEE